MRATLDCSYGLLGEPERGLLGRLSAFVGGFSLPAAEAVGAAGDVDAEAVIDSLGTLVEQSLVTVDPDGARREPVTGCWSPSGSTRGRSWRRARRPRRRAGGMPSTTSPWPSGRARSSGAGTGRLAGEAGAGERQPARRPSVGARRKRGDRREGRRWSEAALGRELPPPGAPGCCPWPRRCSTRPTTTTRPRNAGARASPSPCAKATRSPKATRGAAWGSPPWSAGTTKRPPRASPRPCRSSKLTGTPSPPWRACGSGRRP